MRVGDVLQQHRLAGARRSDDQSALALADRRQQIHHAAGVVFARRFELQPLVGIERRQVVEEDLVARFLRRLEVDRVDFDQREVPLAFLRRPDLAGDGVAGAQVEAPDLRRRDVDVVRAGQIVVLGRAQEAEAVRQALENAFGEDQSALFGLRLQDLEDQFLLAQSGAAGDTEILCDLVQPLDTHVLQLDQVERGATPAGVDSALDGGGGVARPTERCGGRFRRRCGRSAVAAACSAAAPALAAVRALASAAFCAAGSVLPRRLRRDRRALLRRTAADVDAAPSAGARRAFRRAPSASAVAGRRCFGWRPARCATQPPFPRACRRPSPEPFPPGSLPLCLCFRDRLPNFPRSPACYGRERKQFAARKFLRNRSQAAMLFFLIQLIYLRGYHHIRDVLKFQPILELQILLHPPAPGIEKHHCRSSGYSRFRR